MKKVLLSAALGVFCFLGATGQASNVGVHLSAALPVGDFSNATDFGFGGGLTYDYYFNDNFNLGAEVEFLNFPIRNTDEASQLIPLLVTGAYHTDFGNEIDFYGGLGIGAFVQNSTVAGIESVTDFGISPRVGLAYELGNRLFLDVNVRYGLIFNATDATTTQFATGNTSYVGLNVGILYTIIE